MAEKKYLKRTLNSSIILIVALYFIMQFDILINYTNQPNKIYRFPVINSESQRIIISNYKNLPFNNENNWLYKQIGLFSFWLLERFYFNIPYEMNFANNYKYKFVCNEQFKCKTPRGLFITNLNTCSSIDSVNALIKKGIEFYEDDETGCAINIIEK